MKLTLKTTAPLPLTGGAGVAKPTLPARGAGAGAGARALDDLNDPKPTTGAGENTPTGGPGAATPPADDEPGPTLQGVILRGQLQDATALRRFLEAGRAIFTIRSRTSGTRFTFRASRPDQKEHAAKQAQRPGSVQRERPIWLGLLNGPDNTRDFSFVGTLWKENGGYRYAHSPKSKVGLDADSVKAVRWLAHALTTNPTLIFAQAEIWHEGRCGRCGRRLTVPESIDTGFGPECAGVLGLG